MSDSFLGDYNEPKKGKTVPLRKVSLIGDRATVKRTVNRTTEVVVKIVSHASNQRGLNAIVDYIARLDGQSEKRGLDHIALEDEQGNVFIGLDARTDALSTWQGMPQTKGTRRESFHIVFSMPAGTPADPVQDSVRRLAAVEFKRFQYVMGQHYDTDQVHVHLVVNATPLRGVKRLGPNKKDLQRWRETFAENLREFHGIEANATSRAARLETRYSKNNAAIWKETREKGKASTTIMRHAKKLNWKHLGPRLARVYKEYTDLCVELNKGSAEDRKLADQINKFTHSQLQGTQERESENLQPMRMSDDITQSR